MSETTAAAIGRAVAEGRARALRGAVIGPWLGSIADMQTQIEHPDPAERARLAEVAHVAACRRWAELVLRRAVAHRTATLDLGQGDAAVGVRLADGTFAWPGDRVELRDPLTGAVDVSPWIVRSVQRDGCLLERFQPMAPLFGEQARRRLLSEVGMSRLMPWRPS